MRVILFAAALLAAAPAAANVYLATYTGVLIGNSYASYDVSGVFGTPGLALAGLNYRAQYRIDDGLANTPIYIGPDAGGYRDVSRLLGGAAYGTTAPVTATITINGVTVAVDGSGASVALQTHHNFDQTYHYVQGHAGTSGSAGSSYIYAYATLFEPYEFLTSQDLRTPIDVDLSAISTMTAAGSFSLRQFDAANPYGFDWAFGQFRVDHLTIAAANSTVPEPAAWALLVAGFGLVGAALRRTRGNANLVVRAA